MCRSVSTGDLSSCQTVQVKEADERFERIRRVESDAIEEAIETFFSPNFNLLQQQILFWFQNVDWGTSFAPRMCYNE